MPFPRVAAHSAAIPRSENCDDRVPVERESVAHNFSFGTAEIVIPLPGPRPYGTDVRRGSRR
jgi:hypothetical protein